MIWASVCLKCLAAWLRSGCQGEEGGTLGGAGPAGDGARTRAEEESGEEMMACLGEQLGFVSIVVFLPSFMFVMLVSIILV